MLIVEPAMETVDLSGFDLWPVSDLPRGQRFLPLYGHMGELDVGTAMAILTHYDPDNRDGLAPVPPGVTARVRRLFRADNDPLYVAGGLRIRDTGAGVTVEPGCCCGLEGWRRWLRLLRPGPLWLDMGHDPSPLAERDEDSGVVRIWPDVDHDEVPTGDPVRVPLADLPGILRRVHEDLRGFLSLAAQWATVHAPASAEELIARVDLDMEIGAPLAEPGF